MRKALLIIDMINNLDFPEGKNLLRWAKPVAENIRKLKKEFNRKKIPVIYVNDNFGKWKSNWQMVYEKCADERSLGKEIARLLKPEDEDYFILKPKHSGFYSSNLEILLNELKIQELTITGIAGNICVLFTANDAHMRGYKIHVPKNCIASNSKKLNDFAITQFSEVLGINIEEA